MDRIVKVEATHSPESPNIRELFSKCGEIRAFLPYKTSEPDDLHCFIVFTLKAGVERALSLDPGGHKIHVYSLAMNPQLVDQYRSVAPSSPIPVSVSEGSERNISLSLVDPEPNKQPKLPTSQPSESSFSSPVESFFQTFKSSIISNPQEKQQNYLNHVVPSAGSSETLLLPSPLSVPCPSSFPVSRVAPCFTTASYVSPLIALANNGGPFFSLERRIVMSLCGESITYNLEALEEDPQAIIALLKVTSSERGHWMIVAGQYRRNGNPSAAITVLATMIEVMTANGIHEDDIKPAFLMLSGCETDLWKRTRPTSGGESETSIGHHNRSQRWLQKVYGTQRPLPESTDALGLKFADTARSLPADHVDLRPSSTLTPPRANTATRSSSVDREFYAAEGTARIRLDDPSSLQMIQREVQSLREYQLSQGRIIKETRLAKRKLEADYASERSLRRKLERHLNDLNEELNLARRSANYNLEQLEREVETRRRAEDELYAERGRKREMERLSEQRMVKPRYEDLAHQRPAQSDEMAFVGTAHASTFFD